MDSSFSVAIAIDFGTTFSGYAYGFVQGEPYRNTEWRVLVGQKSPYVKTPTYLLYEERKLDSWGYKAKQRLVELREKKSASNYHFFAKFKTKLFSRTQVNEHGEPYLEDKGEKFLLVDLVADYLRKISQVALQDVKSHIKNTQGSTIDETQIRWCLTVPAFWDGTAKRLMEQAAKKAGIKTDDSIEGRFMFVLESEAATAYLFSKRLEAIENKATMMIVDCGGETVNLTVHDIIREGRDKGFRIVESGSANEHGGKDNEHGGKDVDKNFLNYLTNRLGGGVIDKFEAQYPKAYMQMVDEWETFKCGVAPADYNFHIPYELCDLLQKQYPEVLKELTDKKHGDDFNVLLTRRVIEEEIFGPVIDNILARVEEMFNRIGGNCHYLCLVGGFASVRLLQQRISDKFAGKVLKDGLLIPERPGECVMAGAASFAQKPFMKLSLRMRLESPTIERTLPAIYELPVKEDMKNTKNMLRKCHIGQPSFPRISEKVLMVVGAAGAGKTTLINGMINYILGVEWKDDFRFKLIADEGGLSQAHSQTKFITAYTFHKMEDSLLPYTLTIIDTPGFGDTEGLERDKFTTDQIREFFSMPDGVTHLDGIGFVTQSSLARLTPTQKYVFDSILSVFGKDVADNIFIMITFADGQSPPVMGTIKAANIPHSNHFKFNNSALFAKKNTNQGDEDDNFNEFNEMFWQMGLKSFEKFFTDFQKVESRSLQLTKDVLKERKQLEATIEGIQPRIQAGLSKLDEIRQEEKVLEQRKSEIAANKDFTYPVKLTKQRKVDLRKGEYVTNCLKCNCTCHYPCGIPRDDEKHGCAAMGSNGYCTVCGCHWSSHVNNTYRFDLYEENEIRTSRELKERYDQAVSGKGRAESMIAQMNNHIEQVAEDVFSMIQKVQQSLHRLDEIALKPDPLTQEEHLNLLIESEKREAKPGWQQRVAYYEEAKQQAQVLSKMKNDPSLMNKPVKANFRNFVEKLKFW